MNKYFFIIFFCLSIISCQKKELLVKNNFIKVINSYIDDYPIKIKDYNYIVRFYLKNSDTIMEISQDKKHIIYPLEFNLYTTTEQNSNPYRLNEGIKYVGTITTKDKLVYIYDTDKNLGNKFYTKSIIKSKISSPKTFNQKDYPFLPKKRIYKFNKNFLTFIKETDTIKFK